MRILIDCFCHCTNCKNDAIQTKKYLDRENEFEKDKKSPLPKKTKKFQVD